MENLRFTNRQHEGRFWQSSGRVLPSHDADVARVAQTLPRVTQARASRTMSRKADRPQGHQDRDLRQIRVARSENDSEVEFVLSEVASQYGGRRQASWNEGNRQTGLQINFLYY